MIKTYFKLWALILCCSQITTIMGQRAPSENSEPLLLDESIRHGRLDNGLSYYIKPLSDSQEKINLRLYVLAGNNAEDTDQTELSHFLEHMAFKSTNHFPLGIKNELASNKSLNMIERDVRGHDGSNYSYYIFNAPGPPNNEKAISTGLRWFKEIATGLKLDDREIDTERGVLIQEKITGSQDNIENVIMRGSISERFFPCKQFTSDLVRHLETFDSNRLKQFYKDWYRPDLMAILIVGKIDDVDALEKQISVQFSDINSSNNHREMPDCHTKYFSQAPQYAIAEKASDSLENNDKVEINLYYRDKKASDLASTLEGLKRMRKFELLLQMLRNRLQATTKSYNNNVDIHPPRYVLDPSHLMIKLLSRKNSEKEALQTVTHVLQQIRKHGFTDSEFSEAKDIMLSQLERINLNGVRYWVNETQNHITDSEAFPNDKKQYTKKWISNLTIQEFTEFLESVNLSMPEDIGIIAPSGHQVLGFTEGQIRSWIQEIIKDTVESYSSPVIPTELISESKKDSLKIKPFDDLGYVDSGAREIQLNNGVKVILKSYKPSAGITQNQIAIHGFKNKGALAFPKEDYFSAVNAPKFVKNSGVGNYDKFDIQRFMSTNSLYWNGLNLYLKNHETGIKLNPNREDLEKALQLVYLFFLEPRADSLAYTDWKERSRRSYINHSLDPKTLDLSDNVSKILGDYSHDLQGTELFRGLDKTDMNRGFEIYKDLFTDAKDFNFIISGDFSMDSVATLVNKYLGNLPFTQKDSVRTMRRDFVQMIPSGPVLIHFTFPEYYRKSNYLYRPMYVIDAEPTEDWEEKIRVELLGTVLNWEVRNLRFQKGFSMYGPAASGRFNPNNKRYEFGAEFDCTPEEFPLLREEFSKIIRELKSVLISEDLLHQSYIVLKERYDPKGSASTNSVIQNKLYNQYRFDVPWTDSAEILLYLESLTTADIMETAQKYFTPENLYEIALTD